MVERYGEAEPVLPLIDLSGIRAADALATEWPAVETIIGNPPFLGSQLLRRGLGHDYVRWLSSAFGVGVKDLCVYWFRKAHDHLQPEQRAGLVGTNSISQNRARGASLEYIASNGGVITNAVSSQKWPGEAKVHVSIVNWVKSPQVVSKPLQLDGEYVDAITPSLRSGGSSNWVPLPLSANRGMCFQGPIPVGRGFVVSSQESTALLSGDDRYAEIVRPYLDSDDIAEMTDQSAGRWVIDFNQRSLEQATSFSAALDILRDRVKPERDFSDDAGFRTKWWLFGRPRIPMRKALTGLSHYLAVGRHGKRMFITKVAMSTMASDATNVFAFDDDYSMGILLSRAHDAWAWAQSSTLKGDLRYTPTTVFATFPWPDPVDTATREKVAAASSALYARRSELCVEHNVGLTKLYNLLDDGAFTDLAALHKQLDIAVAASYGWPASVAQDAPELVRRLTELNRGIVEGGRSYAPFSSSAD